MAVVSAKHVQIDKANKSVIIATSVAVIVLVFGIFIGKAVYDKYTHQEKVINAKEAALSRLDLNITARDEIVESYKIFIDGDKTTNIIGGDVINKESNKGGDNARIVLDALPSKYDYPALATSINNLLSGSGFNVTSIDGTDEEIVQSVQEDSSSPVPIEILIGASIEGTSYDGVQAIVSLFERSIRPFSVDTLKISGAGNDMSLILEMKTYFQPEKTFVIGEKEIK